MPDNVYAYPKCLFLHKRLYVVSGGLYTGNFDASTRKDYAKIYISSPSFDSWTVLTTPTYYYGLGSFHSKVVLIGGHEISNGRMTNKLWTRDEELGWQTYLPPMLKKRTHAIAANSTIAEDRECLVVAGGTDEEDDPVHVVEILVANQWSVLTKLPHGEFFPCSFILIKNSWYLFERSEERNSQNLTFCKLDLLLADHIKPPVGEKTTLESNDAELESIEVESNDAESDTQSQTSDESSYHDGDINLWSSFWIDLKRYVPALCGQQLVATGMAENNDDSEDTFPAAINIISLAGEKIIKLRETPDAIALSQHAAIGLPNGELVILGGQHEDFGVYTRKVFKASLSSEK